jgi:thiol:disulfide interchange protein
LKSNILRATSILWLVFLLQPLGAQRLDPAKWTLAIEPATAVPGSTVLGRLEVTLEDDWHLYSPTTPAGGPIPTTIELAENDAVASYETFQLEPVTKLDPAFQINTETYAGATTFLYRITLADGLSAGDLEMVAKVRYQLCNDTQCLPPKRKTATAGLTVSLAGAAVNSDLPSGFVSAKRDATGAAATGAPSAVSSTEPGAAEVSSPVNSETDSQGLIQFLLVAFGFGLAALFTPCVFPMIPITVSFFINQETGSRRDSLSQALVFCFGIIGLFTILGLAATALLGPFGVVQLGSNPWVNGFITLVFCAFGLSLLGAFEITLPSGLLTKLNAASQRQGYGGTLIMGLTFSLTAFACVGPFVGTLLAASIQGGGIRPLLGMTSFASGLALPFFFLALFPSYLQRMPRAGGWMSRVKVVLGFIVIAAMFKYLSNVDQVMQWELLSRERFLALWIVLFAMPGLYLLGLLPMEGIERDEKAGVGRVLVGGAFLVFAISLIPGMLGARLGEIEAYIPVPSAQSAFGSRSPGSELSWLKNSYPEALEQAEAEGKLVLVNFTGYACTNCHWMKANMFTRPEIAAALGRYVLVELYTDGTDEASSRNQELQEDKFSTVAIPYYAIVAPDGSVAATFPGLTREPEEFLAFLNGPLSS